MYTEFLAQKDFTQGTVQNHISALKFFGNANGIDLSNFDTFVSNCMFKAVRNTLDFRKKDKVDLSPAHILEMCTWAQVLGDCQHGIRLAIILGFLGLLRVSSYTVDTSLQNSFKLITTLSDCDVKENNLIIRLKKTKTSHNSDPVVVVVPEVDNELLSAVHNYNEVKKVLGQVDESVTPIISFGPSEYLTPFKFNAALKFLAAKVCDFSSLVASHTLRRSGTTHMHKMGATPLQIAKAGTWKSETYMQYILSQNNTKSEVQVAVNKMFQA